MQFTNDSIGGSYGARKVILHNQHWVYKTVRAEWEVRAYEIYKALLPYKRGHWYVPETVYGPSMPDNTTTSLQAYVKDAVTYSQLYVYPCGTPPPIDPTTAAEAAAFDYLIEQSDRHEYNYLIDLAGQLVLIDHGNAFELGYASDAFRRAAPPSYCVDYWLPARGAVAAAAPEEWKADILDRFDQLPCFSISRLDDASQAIRKAKTLP